MNAEAFPLHWPEGQPRSKASGQKHGPFKIHPDEARIEMLEEISRLGGKNVIISSNAPLRKDGAPFSRPGHISDTGVAVYFDRKGKEQVFACDTFYEIGHNIRAIGLTIKALRAIERYGASDMLDRAFMGFQALSAPEQWWQVLGIDRTSSRAAIKDAWRRLAAKHHPDHGGSDAAMSRVNTARDAGLSEIGGIQ